MRKFITLVTCCLFIHQATLDAQGLNCAFTASTQSGCAPLTVSFTDQSTGATSCAYQFDNANSSTLCNPVATYSSSGIYNVRHVVYNGVDSAVAYLQIRVFAPPTVNFTSPNPTGCNSPCHLANFQNQTILGEAPVQPGNYVWTYGDNSNSDTGYNSSHCYSQQGTFSVTLTALDDNGCQVSRTINNLITIGPGPTATASANPTTSCSSTAVVNFTGTGSSPNGAVTYGWNFGNGNSTQQNPTQPFICGVYDPVLTVTDPLNCKATSTVHIDVPCLNAAFTSTSTNGCTGVPMQFNDASNYASSWSWNFGDGTAVSTQQNPTHTYAAAGTYTVSLTVTYAGCTDTETQTSYITITNPVNFTISANSYSSCTAPFTVNFSNTAPGGSTYTWDFGDGSPTSSLSNPSHTYTTTGTFTVTLGVPNSAGCVNTKTLSPNISVGALQPSFTVNNPNGCTPMMVQFSNTSTSNVPITSYSWQFGDAGTSSAQNPSHPYAAGGQYTPTLTVTNMDGCTATYTYPGTINVGTTLVPDFVASPLTQCVNQNVVFTNLTPGTSGTTTYAWEFGDANGIGSTDQNPVYQFSDIGDYDITLTVINQGCTSMITKPLYIHIVAPKADYSFSYNCSNPTQVTFTDASQSPDSWAWDFGDGTPISTQQNPTHNFPAPGTYAVTLTVTNAATGCTDLKQHSITIGPPSANLTVDTVAGCAPAAFNFADASAYATGWLWRFGDGTTSTLQNPTHTYPNTGKYTVTLIINPASSCVDSVKRIDYITVYGVTASASVTPLTGCAPLTVNFTDNSTSYLGTIVSSFWEFGDNNLTATGTTASHTYTQQQGYSTKLKSTDSHGCFAYDYNNVTPKTITASFSADTIACPGEAITFTTPGTTPSPTYQWNFGDNTSSTDPNPTHAYSNSGAYTVTLIATSTFGCKDTLVKTNFVNVQSPVADFNVNSNFSPCPPFPVKFYNTSDRMDLQWEWHYGDGQTGTEQDPLHVYFYPGDYDVTLIAYNAAGCRDSITKVDLIRVRGPVGQFVVTPDSGCVPHTVNISGTVQSAVSVISDLGDGTAYNDITSIVHTYQNVGNYYPIFTLTDSVGCQVSYPIDTIVVGLIPYPNLPPDTVVCRGNDISFNLPYGDHFIWTSDMSTTKLNCDTCKNTISSARDTITYFVTAITNIGCVARDTIKVNVDALPQIYPGLHYRICPNDTLQLSAGPDVKQVTWQPSLYMSDTTSVNPLVWPPDTMTYRVTGGNNTGCTISRIVKIWPITQVDATLSVNGDTVKCEGGAVPLQVNVLQSSFNDTSFQWIPSTYLNSSTIANPVLNAPAGNYTYTVIVRSSTCKADTEQVNISFSPLPKVEAGDDQVMAEGTTVQLWASSPDDVVYQWLPVADSLSCTECRRPFITAYRDQTIPVTVTTALGCSDTAFVKLRVLKCDEKMVFVPNTFTPNNDDLNDRLYVRGGGLTSLDYFRVFDRWGQMVWETHDISQGWDGTVRGQKADVATFVYLVKGTCSSGAEVQKSGNVTLVR